MSNSGVHLRFQWLRDGRLMRNSPGGLGSSSELKPWSPGSLDRRNRIEDELEPGPLVSVGAEDLSPPGC